MQVKPRSVYFGWVHSGNGHCLYDEAMHDLGYAVPTGLPQLSYLDGGLLTNKRVPDAVTGHVYHKRYAVAGVPVWHAFVWWDRSGDKRPSSHSGIYVEGYDIEEFQKAWQYGSRIWKHIITRQTVPLVLPWDRGEVIT